MEAYAFDMEQRSNCAAMKDARVKLRREESASDMGQSRNDAAAEDVQTSLSKVECASDMEQVDCAEAKDAQTVSSKEAYVLNMGQR